MKMFKNQNLFPMTFHHYRFKSKQGCIELEDFKVQKVLHLNILYWKSGIETWYWYDGLKL